MFSISVSIQIFYLTILKMIQLGRCENSSVDVSYQFQELCCVLVLLQSLHPFKTTRRVHLLPEDVLVGTGTKKMGVVEYIRGQ